MKTLITVLLLVITMPAIFAQTSENPNIIFIILDDLNDYVEGYDGHPQVQTTAINEIASNGTMFTKSYCSAPQCGPSRASMLTGKDVSYTKIYRNTDQKCSNFRSNFKPANGNAEIYTLPEWLKDVGGYYTYGINKVMHCHTDLPDYDELTSDECARSLSWNKLIITEDDGMGPIPNSYNDGIAGFAFGVVPDSLEALQPDNISIDSGIAFINEYAATGGANACNKPFFLTLGLRRPHAPMFVTEEDMMDFYLDDYLADPYVKPYNVPNNAYPYNGIVMPPQPEVPWQDYYNLPADGVAQSMARENEVHEKMLVEYEDLPYIPEIDPTLTEDERIFILQESLRANAVISYLSAIKYIDDLVGEFYATLESHPDILNNTIIVVIGDNGYSLGEKSHWRKATLWETDIRVPFIISDMRNPAQKKCNRLVSLLDLFPTLVDMIDISEPTFSDGSEYLDGQSLVPLMENPNLLWERPVITTFKNTPLMEGNCYPQYSIRGDRFHYIKYATNGGTDGVCNPALSQTQAELYDVGTNWENDPNEWNNLIDSTGYDSIISYLENFLPEGDLYLQKANTVTILNNVAPCFYDNDDIIAMKSKLYSPEGVLVNGSALSAYKFTWTNNLTSAVKLNRNYNFNMATLPSAIYTSHKSITFYLTVTEIATGKQVAFNTITIYINPVNVPVVTYTADVSGVSVDIIDYSITGSYTNTKWSFGDGFTTEDFLPATHTYASMGSYTIKNTVYYGNNCRTNFNKPVTLSSPVPKLASLQFNIYPNPATDKLFISFGETLTGATAEIYNSIGQLMKSIPMNDLISSQIDISDLDAGSYIVKVVSDSDSVQKTFEVIR